ncbi:MAG: LPS-assembly protein LptD [Betaproteobacteria bacterium]|nr:LPS-assembly protein LptD [Betaproteobacteria bacterium]
MHKIKSQSICLAVLCSLPLAATAQQGLQLKAQPTLILIPPSNEDVVPLFIDADRIQGHNDKETEAQGDVRLRKRGQAMFADWLRYDKGRDEVRAAGNVRIEQGSDIVEGSRLEYNVETDRGVMDAPRYTLTPRAPGLPPGVGTPRFTDADARGRAERLLFEGVGRYRANRAEYTTCAPGNDDWFIRSGELFIDKGRDVGIARDASVVFLGQTILYSPYLSFSLHQQRKSGFLTPHYGSSSKSGIEFTLPYYWNIAPNRDATIAPRLLTKRGLLLNNEFRYLEPTYSGETRFEILPGDQQKDDATRYALFVQHRQTLPYDWQGTLNVQKASDDTYFTDLSTQINLTSQVLLPREGILSRGGTWGHTGTYGFTAHIQRWQTLQADLLAPVTPPYNRMPQLTFTAQNEGILASDFDLLSSYVHFEHPTLANGRRLLVYPSLSAPIHTSYAYVTPKVGMHLTHYALDRSTTTLPDTTRALPIFSLGSGLVLERDAPLFGKGIIQTLEPALYYVYIPFRDQSQIPNFESGLQDINFATLFSENQFSGNDRINDANQVTLGITSRLIDGQSGAENLRVGLAQRYYFWPQRVTIPGVPPRSNQSSNSDLLAAASGTVARNWSADVGWQYNTDQSRSQRFNVGARYQPQPGKVLNLVYRSTANSIEQTDVSAQWPLSNQWTAVARWNYSLRDRRTIEALGGFEYNGGCWVLRVVGHRFATATREASTSLFVQLELNGISRIGSNPFDILRRNIAGYVRQDPRPTRAEDAP